MKKPQSSSSCSYETAKAQNFNRPKKKYDNKDSKNNRKSFYEFSSSLILSLWCLLLLFYSKFGHSHDNAGYLLADKRASAGVRNSKDGLCGSQKGASAGVRNSKDGLCGSQYSNVTKRGQNHSEGLLLEPNNMSLSSNNSVIDQEIATYMYTPPETSRLENVVLKFLGYTALVCEIQKHVERDKTKTQPKLPDWNMTRPPYLNFDEFRNITRQGKGVGVPNRLVNITHRLEPDGTDYNYASSTKGAKVVAHNKEAKGANNILDKDHDKYLRNPCSVMGKFIVIELAEETLIDAVKIANFEHYSSNFKEFELSGSLTYPTEIWSPLGKFVAANVKQIQSFKLNEPKWVRYLMLNLLSHYGNEFYCTLSKVEVVGVDAIERMLEDLLMASEEFLPVHLQEPNSTTLPSLKPEVGPVETSDMVVENVEDGQRLTDDVVNPSPATKIPDPVIEVRQPPIGRIPSDSVLKILMQKVRSLEINLSVLEEFIKELSRRQRNILPEVEKEFLQVSQLLEKNKLKLENLLDWKKTKEKEFTDLESWKTIVSSHLDALAKENSILRLKVEKIASDQANLENKEMAVLAISLLFASLAIFKLISSRVSAFMRASQGDKVGRANRGWVLILVSSTMTIFITLLSG